MSLKTAIIVDAFAPASLYAPMLKQRGYRNLHIQMSQKPPFRISDFDKNLVYDGYFERISDLVEALRPKIVLSGSGEGARISDKISQILGLSRHDFSLTEVRSDLEKALDTLAQSGVSTGARKIGLEFMLSSVSCNGAHVVTELAELQRSNFNGSLHVEDRIILRRPTNYPKLVKFFSRALNTLGFRNGPAHGVLSLSANGIALAEIYPHPAEPILTTLVRACGGYDQITATLDAAIDPIHFFRKAKNIELQREGQLVYLRSNAQGKMVRELPAYLLSRLPTYRYAEIVKRMGSQLENTVDGLTAPGLIYLVGNKSEEIEQDYRRIRATESAGFYEQTLAS